MEFTREQRANAFDKLSKPAKEFLMSEDFSSRIQKIGKENNLLIDKMGLIEDMVILLAIGLIKIEDFEKILEGQLGITGSELQKVVGLINREIIGNIRKLLNIEKPQKEIGPTDRNDLLEAIENPAPVSHPISIAQEKPVEKTRPSSGAEVAHTFIGEKLAVPVSLPSQKTVIQPEVKKPSPTVDPYREPIS